MTASSTLLALVLMPLCLWIYSRAWIDTPLVRLLPLGAVTLTLCSTLLPISLGVFIRYRYSRVADVLLKVSLPCLPYPRMQWCSWEILNAGASRVGFRSPYRYFQLLNTQQAFLFSLHLGGCRHWGWGQKERKWRIQQ